MVELEVLYLNSRTRRPSDHIWIVRDNVEELFSTDQQFALQCENNRHD
jgi:hypothetical protein